MLKINLSAFIWSIADLLRDDYKKSEYCQVILPFTVLRRLDCVLQSQKIQDPTQKNPRNTFPLKKVSILRNQSHENLHDINSYSNFSKLIANKKEIDTHIRSFLKLFTADIKDVFDNFDFEKELIRLRKNNLLYLITKRFSEINLHPNIISNREMGIIFEELIRKFSELSNETHGEHFTPKEIITLMVNLLFLEDKEILSKKSLERSLYDPALGTGGMLSMAEEHLRNYNSSAKLAMHGQELNPQSYAICKADMLIKGKDISNIYLGNTLSADQHKNKRFDYMLSNPPFGVDWKKVEREVKKEHYFKGTQGRFGIALPRVSDGSLLFLMHLISKMHSPKEGGSRIGIIFNGSPMFTGGAGSGESKIRRYLIENDLLESIIQLPNELFYNTGITTYIWILTNSKPLKRKGKVQLIDASIFSEKMKKSIGSKRNKINANQISEITEIFKSFKKLNYGGKMISKIIRNEEFGYKSIKINHPIKDHQGNIILYQKGKNKGKPKPDKRLQETDIVPLGHDIESYFKTEVLPYSPEAWIEKSNVKIGYEIPFNKHFYKQEKMKSLKEINNEIKDLTIIINEIMEDI